MVVPGLPSCLNSQCDLLKIRVYPERLITALTT